MLNNYNLMMAKSHQIFRYINKNFSKVDISNEELQKFKDFLIKYNVSDIINKTTNRNKQTFLLYFTRVSEGNIGGMNILEDFGANMESQDVFGMTCFSYIRVINWSITDFNLILGWVNNIKDILNLVDFFNNLINAYSSSRNRRVYNDQILTLIKYIILKGLFCTRFHCIKLLSHVFIERQACFGIYFESVSCSDFGLVNEILFHMLNTVTPDEYILKKYIECTNSNRYNYFDEYVIERFIDHNILPTKYQLSLLSGHGNTNYVINKIKKRRYDWIVLRESIVRNDVIYIGLPSLFLLNNDIFKYMVTGFM